MGLLDAYGVDADGRLTGTNPTSDTGDAPGAFQRVEVGEKVACGLRSNGALSCWGPGDFAVQEAGPFLDLTIEGDVPCVLSAGSRLTCFGKQKVEAKYRVDVVAISSDRGDVCGVAADGQYACLSALTGEAAFWFKPSATRRSDAPPKTWGDLEREAGRQVTPGGLSFAVPPRARRETGEMSGMPFVKWFGEDSAVAVGTIVVPPDRVAGQPLDEVLESVLTDGIGSVSAQVGASFTETGRALGSSGPAHAIDAVYSGRALGLTVQVRVEVLGVANPDGSMDGAIMTKVAELSGTIEDPIFASARYRGEKFAAAP